MMMTYRVIEDRVDQSVVPLVAEVEIITHLLIPLARLLPLELVRALFSHLSAVEALHLLFLQPKVIVVLNTFNDLLLLLLGAHVQHHEGVMHQLKLDLPIQRAVRAERCEGIHLKNERL